MRNDHFPRREFMKGGLLAAAGLAAGVGGASQLRASTANGERAVKLLTQTRTVRIPDDYDTLQDAVNEESKWAVSQGVKIILLIQSGHKLVRNLAIMGGDYSHFWIRSEDPVVYLDSGIVFETTPTGRVTALFDLHFCRAPVLDCLVDMEGKGRRGYRLFTSHGLVRNGAGIRRAEEDGIDAGHGSTIWINGGEATGCGRHNLHISHGSMCSARTGGTSNFSGATGDFDHNSAGTNVGFYHGAKGTIAGSICRNAAQDGINAIHASTIDATAVDASNCGRDGVRVGDGGTVHVRTTNLTNCGRHGLSARHCSSIEARDCDVSGAGEVGVFAEDASRIDALGVIARGCGVHGIRAGSAATINARNVDATGTRGGGVDIRVAQGGIINATGATGTLSQAANQLAGAGIIFQE